MKVIFDKTFLSELSDRSSVLEISNYSLVRDWKEISNISDLFNETYIAGDIKSFGSNVSEAIWEADLNLLRLCIDLPEDKKEDFIKNSYKFLYCFWKDSISGSDRIAFILMLSDNPGELVFSDLELTVSRNLINVPFPKNTLAIIKVNQSEDTIFLEGPGVIKGVNIFTAIPNNSDVVSKKSYYTYLKNYKCNASNKLDLPYLNIKGEKVSDISTYRLYSNLVLEIPGANTESYDTPTLDDLNVNGGLIQLYGTVNYEEYEVINGLESLCDSGTIQISELTALKIFCTSTGSGRLIGYTVDNEKKQLIYQKNNDPNTQAQGLVSLEFSYNDPRSNQVKVLKSNSITILQGEGDGSWQVNIGTKFRENNIPLYMLDWNPESYKEIFTITTNILEEPEIEYEDENLFNQFFRLETTGSLDGNGKKTLKVRVSARFRNQEQLWYPKTIEKTEEDDEEKKVSKLCWVKLKVKNRVTQFYCIQRYEIRGMKLFKKVSSSYSEIDSINFQNGSSDRVTEIIYPAKDYIGEEDDSWTVLSTDPEIEVSPKTGKLNDYNLKDQSLVFFNVTSIKRPQTTAPKTYSNLILARSNKEVEESDLTDWEKYIKLSILEIPVTRDGEPISINLSSSNLVVNDVDVYRFLVKSNCSFTCNYSDNKSNNAVVFYDTDRNYFNSSSFNKVSGVYVYIKYIKTMESGYKGTITVTSTDDTKVKQTLTITAQLPSAGITKISPTTDYIFLPASYSASTNLTVYSLRSIEGQGVSFSSTPVFEREVGGYLNHYCTISNSSNVSNYPISRLANLIIYNDLDQYLSSGKYVNYSIYKKGNSPYITVSSSSVTLGNKKDDYIDVTIRTRYKFMEEIVTEQLSQTYNFDYVLSYSSYDGSMHIYNLRLRANQDNTGSANATLGRITLKSSIDPSNFISGETWSQEFIDQIAPPTSKTLYIYQKGEKTVSIGVSGDRSDVSIFGESRIFYVSGPETGFSVEISEQSPNITANYNANREQISAVIGSKFPVTYKPYLIATDKSYVNDSLRNDTVNSFKATIKSSTTDETWPEEIKLTQPGLCHGLLFRCQGVENTLFLSNSGSNIASIDIGAEENEVSVCAGIFNISKELSIGDTGKGIKIKSTDSESSKYSYDISPDDAKYSETGDYNITLKFPANTSSSVKKRTFTLYGTGSDNSGVTHSMTFSINQGGKKWKVYSSEGQDAKLIKAHSSGYIINDLSSFSYTIETDIPEGNLHVSSDLLLSEITTKEEGNSSYGADFKKISINFTIPENHTGALITGKLNIGYKEDNSQEEVQPVWTGNIKQGYFTVKLSDEKAIYYPGDSIGTQNKPITYPARSSGTSIDTIIPYPTKVVQCEVLESGELGDEIELKKEDWNIITSDSFGSGGKAYNWTIYLDGEIVNNGVDTYFDSYETLRYIEHSNEILSSKCPFIANEYKIKPNGEYYRTELLFKIQMWISAYYPEDNGVLVSESDRLVDNFSYIFWIKKKAAPEPEVSISPDSVDVSASGEDIEFTVTSNIELTLTPSSSWIKQKSISGNKYTYTIEANTGKERTGRITATNSIEWGDNSKSITINQAGK